MAHKQTRHRSHPDFRHRSQIPMPAVEDVEQRLTDLLSPSLLAPRQLERRDPRQPQRLIRMRQRLLTLPVMVAIIVSLVWRRVPALAEVQKVLAREGMLWVAPLRVSPQAITKRLDVLPAAVMGQLFAEVCTRAAGPGATGPAAPELGAGAGALPAARHCGRLDAGSAAQKDPGLAGARGPGAGWQDHGDGGRLQSPPAVAAVYRGRGRQ